jgi:hypothetical protein
MDVHGVGAGRQTNEFGANLNASGGFGERRGTGGFTLRVLHPGSRENASGWRFRSWRFAVAKSGIALAGECAGHDPWDPYRWTASHSSSWASSAAFLDLGKVSLKGHPADTGERFEKAAGIQYLLL